MSANLRMKVFRLLRQTRHRYDLYRTLTQALTLSVLLAVPCLGLARIDVWGGRHYLLGRDVPWKHALAGVIVGISAMYVVTFLSNLVAGRLFCGWGCPVGQVSRLGEAIETPGLTAAQRHFRHLAAALYSGVFCVSIMAWWVDLRVFWAGSGSAKVLAWTVLMIGLAGAYAHGRWWRWNFCQQACPIGLYYSFVAASKQFGIHFRNQHSTCIDCDACDHVCPVDLRPRELMSPIPARGGISVHDAPGRNHCLECGDCVRACEKMIELRGQPPVPLRLGYYRGPQRLAKVDAPKPRKVPTQT